MFVYILCSPPGASQYSYWGRIHPDIGSGFRLNIVFMNNDFQEPYNVTAFDSFIYKHIKKIKFFKLKKELIQYVCRLKNLQ